MLAKLEVNFSYIFKNVALALNQLFKVAMVGKKHR